MVKEHVGGVDITAEGEGDGNEGKGPLTSLPLKQGVKNGLHREYDSK